MTISANLLVSLAVFAVGLGNGDLHGGCSRNSSGGSSGSGGYRSGGCPSGGTPGYGGNPWNGGNGWNSGNGTGNGSYTDPWYPGHSIYQNPEGIRISPFPSNGPVQNSLQAPQTTLTTETPSLPDLKSVFWTVPPEPAMPHVLQLFNPSTKRYQTLARFLSRAEAELSAATLNNKYWLIHTTPIGQTFTEGDKSAALLHRRQGNLAQPVEWQVVAETDAEKELDSIQLPRDLVSRSSEPTILNSESPQSIPEPVTASRPYDGTEESGYENLAGAYVGVGEDETGKPCRVKLYLDRGGKFDLDCSGRKASGQIRNEILTQSDGTVFGSLENRGELLTIRTEKGLITFIRE